MKKVKLILIGILTFFEKRKNFLNEFEKRFLFNEKTDGENTLTHRFSFIEEGYDNEFNQYDNENLVKFISEENTNVNNADTVSDETIN
ncbi:hypothetical protein HDU92_002111 [Lobulomyces angularis]|nr:hypothetical protein HDU92_002111 [Lobulomyces angularis]